GDFMVGIDVRDIDPTPAELGSIYLGGFGAPFTRGTAEGIHDSIYVRTMAIGQGQDGALLTVVDAVGMGNQWTRAIRAQAAAATGIPASRIVVATTHSHSGPDFQGLWGGVGGDYRARVTQATVDSMNTAWQDRVPATLHAGELERTTDE